jgi:uncharacterized protein (TIGR03905 family)
LKKVYKTTGVCSDTIDLETEGGVVKYVNFHGGCPGNAQAISVLVVGMRIDDVVERLIGIRCGRKPTSCPDQLAQALMTMTDNG